MTIKPGKLLRRLFTFLVLAYFLLCALLFFFQDSLIFIPQKLDKDYKFSFEQKFDEFNIKTKDGKLLNGILFRSIKAKGLIFYLHGNAGNLNSWGWLAKKYTDLNYDVFMIDYRGYGKSDGSINSESQLYEDIQAAYDEMKKNYAENNMIVLGYSIGTGPAAKLASTNHPRLLILQAPYYSMADLVNHRFVIAPTFLLKYKFKTYRYLKNCNMPIVIFHGTLDNTVYYNSSIKLKQVLKQGDTLITLDGQGHNGITDNSQYLAAITEILN